MTQSMTGFASLAGQMPGYVWAWDIRSVNGKGLDLRLRLPDWIDGLEAGVRAELAKGQTRGNVSLTLKLSREDTGTTPFRVNTAALRAALSALAEVEAAAMDRGLTLSQASQADVLALRGVMDSGAGDEPDSAPLRNALLADLPTLLASLHAMRASEGSALFAIITAQIDQIAALTGDAIAMAGARKDAAQAQLRDALARVLGNSDGVDPARLTQELALIAVKSDVTEELDRLTAHIAAARSLLAEPGAVGRKLDFLIQEFMREANTLCSKAQSIALTRIGLDLKVVIDQMREQVQNVE
jgi:uncharacterized protein (TIGR00255 family)